MTAPAPPAVPPAVPAPPRPAVRPALKWALGVAALASVVGQLVLRTGALERDETVPTRTVAPTPDEAPASPTPTSGGVHFDEQGNMYDDGSFQLLQKGPGPFGTPFLKLSNR